jgi:hypothetical protein
LSLKEILGEKSRNKINRLIFGELVEQNFDFGKNFAVFITQQVLKS